MELRLEDNLVKILAIEREQVVHPVPRGTDRLKAGDSLVVFGRAAFHGSTRVGAPV